jgi:hypothetical protein
LIEPAFPKEELDVAVVGISNWALDAAKMNRAIHLSRPDPDILFPSPLLLFFVFVCFICHSLYKLPLIEFRPRRSAQHGQSNTNSVQS